MTDGDIHNRSGTIENNIERIQNLENDTNREILLNFKDYLYSEGLSDDRLCRHLTSWIGLIEHVDFDLDEASKEDIVNLVGKVNRSEVGIKDELADSTKAEYRKSIRKLYGHFLDATREDFGGEEMTDFFSVTASSSTVDPERLPRPRHVRELVSVADRTRDKAFLMVLWSSAGRIGEVLGLKWKDVRFKDEVAKIHFRDTKTDDDRYVPLLAGYLYLKELYEEDHKSNEPEAFLFRSITTDEQISHSGASQIITRLRKYTDIPERIKTNPHAFRKGRATYLAGQGMTEPQLCEFGGWVQGSDDLRTYVRMAKSDVEAGIKQVAGLEVEEKEEERDVNPVKCHNCGRMNKFEAENCSDCDEVLETSEVFKKAKIEESTKKLNERIVKERVGLDDEKINQHAKQIVAEDLGLEPEQL
jgi:integrase